MLQSIDIGTLLIYFDIGQSELYETGSSGVTSEDMMFDVENPRKSEVSVQQGRPNLNQDNDNYHGLWSNSSR